MAVTTPFSRPRRHRVVFAKSLHLSERAPFTSANVGSIPVGNDLCSYMKRVRQRSAESRGFSPGTPISSHGEC